MSEVRAALRPDAVPVDGRPLALRLGQAVADWPTEAVPAPALAKLKLCLLDFLACALEASRLPWATQAAALAGTGGGPCSVIGTGIAAAPGDAVFANSVAGHGLVREDMHTGSVSHLGIVVLPVLLALAEQQQIGGKRFAAAAVVGYEVGGRIGRALVTPEFARSFRPTGFVGPLAAAAAASHLLGLDAAATASALSLAANLVGGQNQWPHSGADEMFFEAGTAARNGLVAAQLASMGAHGSAGALDGEAGLLPVYRADRRAPEVRLFDGEPEIMSVFFKPVPVCNFAQTPCLAALALALAGDGRVDTQDIAAVDVKVTRAAIAYPGCNHAGPFARVLQAKMSIQYAVAAALLGGVVDEASYARLDEPALLRLAQRINLEVDDGLSAAFPARQGAEVSVRLGDGRVLSRRLDDVLPADPALIRRRFRSAASALLGEAAAGAIEADIDGLENVADVGALLRRASFRR